MLRGSFSVYDWCDQLSDLTLRVADYEPTLAAAMAKAHAQPQGSLEQRDLSNFNNKVLAIMGFELSPQPGEAPLYYWVRCMKSSNKLSNEDGVYTIPDNLAGAIARCPGARHFVRMLG